MRYASVMAMHRRSLKRVETPGHARFLTWSCYHRLPLFRNDRIKIAFVEQIRLARQRLGFHLYGWVIMPEHVHLLIMPNPPQVTVTRVLHAVKRPFASRVLERWRELEAPILSQITDRRGREHFWQSGGGYDRNIFSAQELYEKLDYLHDNPRRRGLVQHASEWPWSSLRWYEKIDFEGPSIDPLPV